MKKKCILLVEKVTKYSDDFLIAENPLLKKV